MKRKERRSAIVESAIHLFAQKGFRGATTRELAAALGVSEPVLYQHFETKRDLYSAIIEMKAAEGAADKASMLRYAEASDDKAFFSAAATLILRGYDDPDTMRLMLYSCLEGHDMAEMFFDRLYNGFSQLISKYIRRRIREGAFRSVNPDIAARGFIGMTSYHGHIALFYPERLSKINVARTVREMVAVFLEGICPRHSAK